jgi:hypothetical protein
MGLIKLSEINQLIEMIEAHKRLSSKNFNPGLQAIYERVTMLKMFDIPEIEKNAKRLEELLLIAADALEKYGQNDLPEVIRKAIAEQWG